MSDAPPRDEGPGARATVPLPPGYELIGRLGSGGFASVWLAEQGRLGRRVAVKVLTQSLVDAETERRFLAECRAVGRLSGHPAVVTVHDAGTTDQGHPFLVMEHLPGGSLQDRLRSDGPLPWAEVVAIGVRVADALAAAHAAGILHRDVKPANVLLDGTGEPRLGDFGIARLADAVQTATGVLVGTIPFTPPDVLKGEPVTPGADVWALGVTLHTLLTGSNPFVGDRDEAPAVSIARVLRCEVPALPPSVPAPLRELLTEMVDADPTRRPDGAAEVVRRLRAVQRERGLPVTPAVCDREGAAEVVDGQGEATDVVPTPLPAPPVPAPHPRPGGPDPDGVTVAGAHAWTTGPDAAPVGETAALPAAARPAIKAPGAGPAPSGGRRAAGGRGRLLVALAAALAMLLLAGVVATLVLRDGDEDDDAAGGAVDPVATPEAAGPAGSETVDSPIGAPIAVPSAADSAPTEAWDLGEVCRPPEDDCVLMGADGDLVVLHTVDGSRRLTRVAAATGEETATTEIPGPTAGAGLARIGDVLVVAGSGPGGERVYRGLDPDDLTERWTLSIPGGDGPVLPGAQLSEEVGVIVLRTAEHIVVDLATGEERRDDGRVLATDRQSAYLAVDDRVLARDLRTGATTWELDVASSAPGPGEIPSWRHGVVRGSTLVLTTATGEVIGVAAETGDQLWSVPLSAEGTELGRPVAVAASGERVVVVAESGDMGLDPGSGDVAWRIGRDRLVLDPDLDGDTIEEARGQPVWVGQEDVLVAGWAGVGLRSVSTADGEPTGEVSFPPSGEGWDAEPFAGGLAVLGGGRVEALSSEDLTSLWTLDAAGVTSMVAVDGGVVLRGPDGVRAFRA